MGIDILGIAGDSLRELVRNRTILAYAIIGGLICAALSFSIIPQFSALSMANWVRSLTPSFSALAIVGIVIVFLVGVFISGAIISAVNSGRKARFLKAARNSLDRYPTLLATNIIVSIIVGIGFVLLIIPGIYLLVRLITAQAEVVVGKKGVEASLKGSWNKTRGRFWSVFAIGIVLLVAVCIISAISGIIFTLAGARPIADFVSSFIGYSFTIMGVLIYLSLSKHKTAGRARKVKRA